MPQITIIISYLLALSYVVVTANLLMVDITVLDEEIGPRAEVSRSRAYG